MTKSTFYATSVYYIVSKWGLSQCCESLPSPCRDDEGRKDLRATKDKQTSILTRPRSTIALQTQDLWISVYLSCFTTVNPFELGPFHPKPLATTQSFIQAGRNTRDYDSSAMAADAPPTIKPPELTPRKPVAPGPNSWAQSQNQTESNPREHESPRPTKCDRYENKPMPKLPQESLDQSVRR